jgi:hypothetical protein
MSLPDCPIGAGFDPWKITKVYIFGSLNVQTHRPVAIEFPQRNTGKPFPATWPDHP